MGSVISFFKSPEQNHEQEKRTKEPEKRDRNTEKKVKSKKPENDAKDAQILIAVVGPTGSGLSQFIHDVTGSYQHGVAPKGRLEPYTNCIQAIPTRIKSPHSNKPVTLIDTPGFDYSSKNAEHTTFKQLAEWLKKEYGSKTKLDGVIYIHNIWNQHHSPFSEFNILEKLCGRADYHRKVIFVNSHWDEGIEGDDRVKKESLLKEGYWRLMIDRGSMMMRYGSPGDQGCAQGILNCLI